MQEERRREREAEWEQRRLRERLREVTSAILKSKLFGQLRSLNEGKTAVLWAGNTVCGQFYASLMPLTQCHIGSPWLRQSILPFERGNNIPISGWDPQSHTHWDCHGEISNIALLFLVGALSGFQMINMVLFCLLNLYNYKSSRVI